MNRKARCPGSRFAYVPRASGDDSGPLFVWFLPPPGPRGPLLPMRIFALLLIFAAAPALAAYAPHREIRPAPEMLPLSPPKGATMAATVSGVSPCGDDPGFGAPHPNGGGFVAKTASVAKTAFVGPQAKVCDKARVFGNARIYGLAYITGRAQVFGDAQVGGNTFIADDAKIHGKAHVTGRTHVLVTAEFSKDKITRHGTFIKGSH